MEEIKTETLHPYKERMEQLQKELEKRAEQLRQEKRPLIVVFEGQDAAGKSGCIRRLTRKLDNRQYRVVSVAKPTEEESRYHYLHRFWRALPPRGDIVFFDRSWYGRVLVERVEGFCSQEEWRRAYDEINAFEKMLWDDGAILVKFWLDVSEEEQLRRFRDRMETPEKRHKLTDEDWRNRSRRPAYEEAKEDMLRRTSPQYAPWTVIPADSKKRARIAAAETILSATEHSPEGVYCTTLDV